MGWHPIQGGVEILLIASCYRNRDKLRPDGPLGSHADFTFFTVPSEVSCMELRKNIWDNRLYFRTNKLRKTKW